MADEDVAALRCRAVFCFVPPEDAGAIGPRVYTFIASGCIPVLVTFPSHREGSDALLPHGAPISKWLPFRRAIAWEVRAPTSP